MNRDLLFQSKTKCWVCKLPLVLLCYISQSWYGLLLQKLSLCDANCYETESIISKWDSYQLSSPWDSSCSKAVELMPYDQEVVGSNTTGCWAFFSSLAFPITISQVLICE